MNHQSFNQDSKNKSCCSYPRSCRLLKSFIGWVIIIFIVSLTRLSIAENITVSVSGNTRTKSAYIENIVRDYLYRAGIETATEIDIEKLTALILDKELFSEVIVTVSDETVHITVKDRWTLIPIPLITSQSDQDTKYGLFVIERNFLGYGKTAIVGGMFSESQSAYFLAYQDPEIALTNWTLDAQTAKEDKVTYRYENEDKIFGDERTTYWNYFKVGYSFSEKFIAAVKVESLDITFDDLDEYEQPDDYRTAASGLIIEYDAADFRFYYKEGWQARLEMAYQFYRDDNVEKVGLIEGQVNSDINLIGKQVLQTQVRAGFLDNGDDRDLFRLGGSIGFRGIQEQGVWVDRFAALSIDYQIPVWSGDLGTWTVAPFSDFGYLNYPQDTDAYDYYASIGIGTYLFLKDVALPGVGIRRL